MSAQQTTSWVPAPLAADTFGNRVRLLRLSLDLSVSAIARKCGVAVPTWRTWEHGALPQNQGQAVRKIHEATGVDMAWLMWGGPDQGLPRSTWNPDNVREREMPELRHIYLQAAS